MPKYLIVEENIRYAKEISDALFVNKQISSDDDYKYISFYNLERKWCKEIKNGNIKVIGMMNEQQYINACRRGIENIF